jgi:hypothetical protein
MERYCKIGYLRNNQVGKSATPSLLLESLDVGLSVVYFSC